MSEPTPPSAPPPASEDTFFVLRYCREQFQRRLEDVVRQCGMTTPAVIEAFTQAIGKAHDELASHNKSGGFDETVGLTASRISLVGHDELDLEIRIGDLAAHLKNNENIGHWQVLLRYMTLLNRRDIRPEHNPLGLEPITQGLWAICHESGFTLEQNLILLDRLEEMLQLRLPEIYTELNGLLEHHRVEPAQANILQRPSSHRQGSDSGNNGQATSIPNALASLQQALRQQSGAVGVSADSGDYSAIPFTSRSEATAGNAVLNAPAMVMLSHLMERLNALESQQFQQATGSLTGPGNAPLHALRSKDLDLPLGGTASIALDTLSMIFEAIFAAPTLPDSVKTAIGRLQIPLLKRAILDPSFFNDAQHPARQAVNLMARAAIGLPRDTRHDHPTCTHLATIADAVRAGLDAESGDISMQLDALNVLIGERDQSTQNAAQPYIQLVRDHESRAAASTQAQSWLLEIQQQPIPNEVSRFFSQCWLRVMEMAYRADGNTGEHWKSCESAAKDLLWSIQPKPSAEERKELLLLIPTLLKRINAGLDQVSISAEERKPFLDACFDLQTAALRHRPADVAPPSTTSPPPSDAHSTKQTAPQVLELNAIRVKYQGQSSASAWHGNTPWKEGDWIGFQMPGSDDRLCGRLCWQGSPYGTAVLFNSTWSYAVALAPALLDQQFRNKQAEVTSHIQLFDEAAARALGQVRPA